MNKMEKWRLDEQRRLDQRRRDDLKLADMRAADERARIELRHSDSMRLADMRTSADPATRAIGEKVQMVMDSRARQEQREADLTGREPHMDPGWLARWEREGAMITLDPAERDKLREVERMEQQQRQEREVTTQAKPDHVEERAPEPKAATSAREHAHEHDEDEDLEM